MIFTELSVEDFSLPEAIFSLQHEYFFVIARKIWPRIAEKTVSFAGNFLCYFWCSTMIIANDMRVMLSFCMNYVLEPHVKFREFLSTRIIEEEESRIKAMWTNWYQNC